MSTITSKAYLDKKKEYYQKNKERIKAYNKKHWKKQKQKINNDPILKAKIRDYQRELMRKKLGTKPENFRVNEKGEPIKKGKQDGTHKP